ncbi:branched-chain amino acid ABC transporter permease [Aquabacter spiritensis]|uniref:Amino acid/amide ABC transporter membrane protein 2 (HAAT family) n=1 Tax=Aquabacter spiritensis TaxID=933073 RepID=A0A4R3LX50_9HYPH|nr:branched-chain amino acid ABC transporter permease [Aquabacter spiritensis]TCT05214.1 amino acid/amide ABC transporter membrane protein 2 (HAAT family) [Aquabacter spiritensis]
MTRFAQTLGLPLVLFLLLAAAPLWADTFTLSLLARAMIFALAAISLDLILGGAGLVSFGHAALMGIGAYGVGILMAEGVSEALIAFPVAMAAAGLFALATGALSLKTRGVYFIMITLAFGQMAFFVAQSLSAYGGDDGLSLAARSLVAGERWLRGPLAFHYTVLGLLAAGALLCGALLAAPFGRVLRAAKDNERRVRALGLDPYPYRLVAYGIAGALAGLSGALFANLTEFVSPAFLSWHRSGELIVMVVAGGMAAAALKAGGLGRPGSALLGALLVVLLEEALSDLTEHWRIVFGPLLVLLVLAGGKRARGGRT